MSRKYSVTLTENQMGIVRKALEFYMRSILGQHLYTADELAFMDVDLSPENPEHEKIFDTAIIKRDALAEVFRAAYAIVNIQKKPGIELEAETIWDAIRHALGQSNWPQPFQSGTEPVPEISEIGGGE